MFLGFVIIFISHAAKVHNLWKLPGLSYIYTMEQITENNTYNGDVLIYFMFLIFSFSLCKLSFANSKSKFRVFWGTPLVIFCLHLAFLRFSLSKWGQPNPQLRASPTLRCQSWPLTPWCYPADNANTSFGTVSRSAGWDGYLRTELWRNTKGTILTQRSRY